MESVPITTKAVSSNLAQGADKIMWYRLSVTCGRSVVFAGFSTNKADSHDITEILLKVALSNTKSINRITAHCAENYHICHGKTVNYISKRTKRRLKYLWGTSGNRSNFAQRVDINATADSNDNDELVRFQQIGFIFRFRWYSIIVPVSQ